MVSVVIPFEAEICLRQYQKRRFCHGSRFIEKLGSAITKSIWKKLECKYVE